MSIKPVNFLLRRPLRLDMGLDSWSHATYVATRKHHTAGSSRRRHAPDPDECREAVERALILRAKGGAAPPAILGVRAEGGGFHVKAALADLGRPYFAAKINANFPGNPSRLGLPTIQGVVVLCDGNNGSPLALMDSMEITSLRTAATTAAAARVLAPSDARALTLCGCGAQGAAHLRALVRVLSLERAWVHDHDPALAQRFAREMSHELGLAVDPVTVLGTRAAGARCA